QTGRELYTQDVNACVTGCFDAGATEVVVRDGHGSGKHLLIDKLDPRVSVVQGGTPGKRFHDIEGSDALILLGYHAMAGTLNGLLEHTYSSKDIQNMWLDGEKCGEFGFDAAIAAEYGVPTIMASGDDKLCAEVAKLAPDVVTCEVKKGLACQAAELLPLDQARELITRKTTEAIEKIGDIRLLAPNQPVVVRKELVERGMIKTGTGITIIDGRTTEISGTSLEEIFFRI
ncbi:MAG: M55 family metallopeptidase, partial [Victivallales bacterium]|nr:M55 family metallopeptidase [Victivallales bacterium]